MSVEDLFELIHSEGLTIEVRSGDAPIRLSFADIDSVAYTVTRPYKHSDDPDDDLRAEGVWQLVSALRDEIVFRAGVHEE